MRTITAALTGLLMFWPFIPEGHALSKAKETEAKVHVLNPSPATVAWGYYWSKTPPVLTIRSGDRVKVRTLHVGNPETLEKAGLPPEMIEPEVRDIYREVKDKGPGGHILTGPIFIENAEPGDVLEVRIISLELAIPYAYNTLSPDRGFLSGEFDTVVTRIIPLDRERLVAEFSDGIEIPLRPFFGSMGVAPPEDAGRINSAPPWIHGGNLDNKELVAGTTLFLPVHVKGALFQVGDAHAAQGNGEVDITALETSLKGELQFFVHKDQHLNWPRAETPTHYISMGTNENLTEAAKIALREMISFLATEKGLSREQSYMLCSAAVDFNITQLVDGKVGVHGMLPKEIFVK
ncbi:MAG: acetamidase/formamidase family protein [Candidatus Aminicenantes bacterium]|nr:acetamidase/formamidase family protein [Candidatus Aminicenantes bacterium]